MKIKEEDLPKQLLWKMYKLGCWGTRHICESNLPKGFPPQFRSRIYDTAEELRKKGFLVKRPSHHEPQWYLNWDKKKEIEEIISDLLPKF